MFVDEEFDALEQITQFWLSNECDQAEKMKADVNTILNKIDYLHFLRRIAEQEGFEKARAYAEETGKTPESFTDDEIRTTDKIAQYWQEHTKEQDKEIAPYVNRIRLKIEMWRLDKGREYYEKHELLGMFEEKELKVLRAALTGFIDAKAHPKEDVEVAKSILERLEEP